MHVRQVFSHVTSQVHTLQFYKLVLMLALPTKDKIKCPHQKMVAHASTREAEEGGSLSLRTAWSTQQVPGKPGLRNENGGGRRQQTPQRGEK